MKSPAQSGAPSSLFRATFRRSISLGRVYIGVGVIYIVVLAVALSATASSSFASSFPIFLPIFSVVGSMGALIVFTNDRTKGVFEYLIAYGISPRKIFGNVLLACLLIETLVLGILLGIGLGIFVAWGHSITIALVEGLLVYSVPMSYASAAFAATVGMFWTSLSSPWSGMSSPIGLVPFIGIAPSLLSLVLVAVLAINGFTDTLAVIAAVVGVVVLLVLTLLSQLERLMPRERLLSPV